MLHVARVLGQLLSESHWSSEFRFRVEYGRKSATIVDVEGLKAGCCRQGRFGTKSMREVEGPLVR
jgi:DNA-directed RNA polymerase subunit N (RpoN/RPB10)